ncbi:Serine/Threonine kinase domain protein (macronuclear) [Tetrahymena thermophila SB210]|uniref:non-specific serine/threonine protein kinase n=1 Tax=Tetrahymena thermophila (strain SB210) TaxID=312017 RepID=I7LTU9_TETTS|nr:Serine/Threonine kinase domain protein [Tetrahymena thermophila SB210]EAR87332.2 Serine/Threonine kinase domain protein [Tetrahymena thermophila SB210]|eukprot:XP_001007577.2 Serine/Threonine kinase domain protein [Tetrahymena thermophila SB210]
MGQEQAKPTRQINQHNNNKQIKSCNAFEDNNDPASPLKAKQNNNATPSIKDLQQQMGLDDSEILEIIDYLKKSKYFLDQTILGKGGNGYVLKGIDAFNYKVAIKVLKCETEEQYLQNQYEYENMKQCNSKYVVKVKDLLHYHNSKSSIQFLIMERCLTDLKQFMKDKLANNIWMSKKYIYETCLQLVLGLKAIHNKNVLHLDIKPANLLLGLDLKWKYTDLGVSKNVDDERDHTVNLKGITACYSSPEQYQLYQFQSNKKITKQCDIYSLGVVFMELTGVDIRKKWVIKQKIRQKPFDKYLNPEFQEFNDAVLKNMMQYNANQRIQLDELEVILKNLINQENKQSDSQESTTQDDATRKSVVFLVEESSPSKRVKSIHKKSFSVSEDKFQDQQASNSAANGPSQIYQIQKSGNQSPSKRIIIPIEKIQSYNYSKNVGDSPENSPLKKRTTKIITRQVGGSKTPLSNKQSENIYMTGMSLTPNKQRNSQQNIPDQQEIFTKQNFNPARRAVSMHQNQEMLPPIQGINRIQQMNNNAYNNSPSPISFMKRSFIQQQQQNIPVQMVSSQLVQNSSSQSPINKNKKASSKSFSQKIIIPKKLIPGNFNGIMMTKNQFDQQFLVSN